MALAVGNDAQFARTAEVLGHPEWASDVRFKAHRARVENRAEIDGLVGEALARDNVDAWLTKLKAAGVPCGKINSVAGALEDTHTAARDMVTIVRDRVQDALKKKMTLEQVKAARPALDYEGRYGSDTGTWTTAMFIEGIYKDLSKGRKPAATRSAK